MDAVQPAPAPHENLAFLFSCNCAGEVGGRRYAGHSLFVDPLGTVVAEGGDGESIVSADVDMQMADAVRRVPRPGRPGFQVPHDYGDRLPFGLAGAGSAPADAGWTPGRSGGIGASGSKARGVGAASNDGIGASGSKVRGVGAASNSGGGGGSGG